MTFLYIFLEYFSYFFKCKKSLPTKLSCLMYNCKKHIFFQNRLWSPSFGLSFHPMYNATHPLVITIMTSWKLLYLGLSKHGFYFMWPKYASYHDAAMIARRTHCIKVVYIYTTLDSRFYLLPKIHKRLHDVPCRPVISNCGFTLRIYLHFWITICNHLLRGLNLILRTLIIF